MAVGEEGALWNENVIVDILIVGEMNHGPSRVDHLEISGKQSTSINSIFFFAGILERTHAL